MSQYLGVDVGSISTNLALIDEEGKVLSKVYLRTQGQPIEAIKKGIYSNKRGRYYRKRKSIGRDYSRG